LAFSVTANTMQATPLRTVLQQHTCSPITFNHKGPVHTPYKLQSVILSSGSRIHTFFANMVHLFLSSEH